jgi:DNA mismatch repair ATPase MutS
VLARAKTKLRELETRHDAAIADARSQIALFDDREPPISEVEATLQALDVDRMTPIDALVTLSRLVDLATRNDD